MLHSLPPGLQFLELESFEPAVGEDFYVESHPKPIPIRLDRAEKLPNGPAFLPRTPFSLLWSTELNISLMLGIYNLSHGSWGTHPVYVEPMHFFGERRVYQSVFF